MLAVAGDVGADDFPKKIVDATVQYVLSCDTDVLRMLSTWCVGSTARLTTL